MKVIYHLGYPRTGTTYLQKNLFPLHSEINYAGPKDYIQSHQTALTLQKLDLLGNIYTSKEIEDDKYDLNELKKIIDIEKFSKDKVNIVSSERYTMFTNINEFNDIKLLNKFLKSFYPNLEVEFLIVLRNQYDLIKSLYFHKYRWISKILNIKNFNEFVKFLRKDLPFNTDNYLFLNFIKNFNFLYMNDKIETIFPKSKINYLKFETLGENKEAFFSDISKILNINEKETLEISERKPENVSNKGAIRNIYRSSFIVTFLNFSLFLKLKKIIPNSFKTILVNILNLFTKNFKKTNEDEERKIFFEYFLESNEKFYDKTKIKYF